LHQDLILSSTGFGQIGAFAKLERGRDVASICTADLSRCMWRAMALTARALRR